ncbi:MAG: hypothetical protein GEU73_07785 [Chloroflexi bacterium]|nr:hypothetical protein [Chloroflexota bacterium]
MKIRSVRPEFFSDPRLVNITPRGRLLYIGLWCYVDDEGRGEWLPKLIEGSVFPLEQVDINTLLGELVDAARIVPYEVDDRMYFWLPSFERHQKPQRKFDSKIPEPPPRDTHDTLTTDATPASSSVTLDDDITPGESVGESGTQRTYDVRDALATPVVGEGEGEGVVVVAVRDDVTLPADTQQSVLDHIPAFKTLRKRKRWPEFESVLADWSDHLGPEGLAAAVDQFGRLVRDRDLADTPAVLRIACERTATIRLDDPDITFDDLVARLEGTA